MPVTTCPRPTTSDARTKLAEAHAALAAAHAAVQTAEASHDEATTEYYRAKSAVTDIQNRIDALARQWGTAGPGQREDLRVKHDECQAPLREAKLPLMQLGIAAEAAEARVTEARQCVSLVQFRLRDAAAAVVRHEAAECARPMIEQVEKAAAVILMLGPDVYRLMYDGLLQKDVLDTSISRLLNISTTEWHAFEQRFRASPWRGAVVALEQDAEATLPTAPAA